MKSDIQIQQDVMDQLKWEPDLNAAEIGVAVKNGIVTLSGIVDTYSKKIAAEYAAKKIAGVRAVAEDIQVGMSPTYRKTDAEIADAVLFALRWNTSIPDQKIKVKIEDGIVSLEGELEWEYQRNEARQAVEKLAGVRRINNFISIKPSVKPVNVKEQITAALIRSATIESEKIAVDTDGGKVVLRGRVRSIAEREDAENAAWAAPGVTSVVNDLVVEQEEFAF
ncbi:BON domain-containing protein [Niastella caeni]|uniref:BON domain-containing protein n=1 Tax=Niastella caeni TaxID=2569763 RepID=A0A4S8I1K0_9BACT|nr:BON domain-containing protein [Niastella caeni]THU39572.1 BON domain-containing protein [Niastella caeni]